MSGLRRAVFLDRDGVLDEPVVRGGVPHPPESLEELVVTAGAEEACRAFKRAGLLLIMVTNQPDLARGTAKRETVDAINEGLRRHLGLDAVFMCPHDDADCCTCRKPGPSLLLDAASRWRVDLGGSVMVGDRWRDVAAGRNAGCATVLVRRDYGERPAKGADHVVASLREAVPWILRWTAVEHGSGSSPSASSASPAVSDLRIKIFADGADQDGIAELARSPHIKGFTTNPTLMRAAGVADYEEFARGLLPRLRGRPISFEVVADDFPGMERQARRIAGWGDGVYVKIPITNTGGESSQALLRRLAADGVKLNVTALLTLDQVRTAAACLAGGPPCFISVFAGRVADSGRDPVPLVREAVEIVAPHPNLQLIWASPREVLNVLQADSVGCHVITLTHDLLRKLPLVGRDLDELSLDTVRMFHRDARAAGFVL